MILGTHIVATGVFRHTFGNLIMEKRKADGQLMTEN